MPKLRALWHAVRGVLDRRRAGGSAAAVLDSVGVVPGKPHVMTIRSGALDTDLNYHMNNAAFLIHAEFARWHMLAKAGLVTTALRERWQFMVGSQFTRFRHGLLPFRRYELRTDLAHLAEDKFVDPETERVMAQVLLRAFIYSKDGFVNTKRMADAMPLTDAQYQALCDTQLPQMDSFVALDASVSAEMEAGPVGSGARSAPPAAAAAAKSR